MPNSEYRLSYEKPGQINLIKGTKFDERLKLVDEYIHFNTGDQAWRFNVDNESKTIEIYPAEVVKGFGTLFPKVARFKIWENSYSDVIYPGKIEKIHIDTRVRSCSYGDVDTSFDVGWENIASLSRDMNFAPSKRATISYTPSNYTMAILERIYLRYKKHGAMPIFKPEAPRLNMDPVKYIDYDLDGDCEIHHLDGHDDWLVFCKTEPNKFFMVRSYTDATKLLAKLKYDGMINNFICGTALFEDYYFMPICYSSLGYDSKTKMVELRNPKENIINHFELLK